MTQCRTKSAFTSTGTLISVVSVLIYCAGFVRVEIKLNEQEERMSEMEKLLRVKDPSLSEVKSSKKDPTMDLTGKTSGIHSDIANDIRIKRHVANDLNTTENKERDQFVVRLDSLLSDKVMKLCQAKHSCSEGPPGPPGQPGPRGTKGSRGRRGKKRNKGRRRNHGIAWKRWKARHHGPSGAQRRAREEGTDRAPRGDW